MLFIKLIMFIFIFFVIYFNFDSFWERILILTWLSFEFLFIRFMGINVELKRIKVLLFLGMFVERLWKMRPGSILGLLFVLSYLPFYLSLFLKLFVILPYHLVSLVRPPCPLYLCGIIVKISWNRVVTERRFYTINWYEGNLFFSHRGRLFWILNRWNRCELYAVRCVLFFCYYVIV